MLLKKESNTLQFVISLDWATTTNWTRSSNSQTMYVYFNFVKKNLCYFISFSQHEKHLSRQLVNDIYFISGKKTWRNSFFLRRRGTFFSIRIRPLGTPSDSGQNNLDFDETPAHSGTRMERNAHTFRSNNYPYTLPPSPPFTETANSSRQISSWQEKWRSSVSLFRFEGESN
ncbi:hypothetical protein CDAR_473351 [Caerostris darwini]|uniref:Uncharacterized protein n=1 Tax=Caerostris darwini TaxID=1538125 RepID=A0AAV4TXL7_9ARAC|nr:hypothetical protein CDAR_473351 [Caerostris darwini]